MITAWHCDNLYSGGKSSVFIGQDCIVTASTTQLVQVAFPSGTSSNPMIVRDDGTLVFGLGIVIFFLAIMFFGLLFNSFGLRK